MNVDGSGLRQVTDSNTNEEPSDFSPDGSQLLITQGISFFSSGPGFIVSGCPEAYVIPLNLTAPVAVSDTVAAPSIKLRSLNDDGGISSKACLFSRAQWRTAPEITSSLGTAASGTGLNRGLSGNMFYTFAGDYWVNNLSSGVVKSTIRTTNDLYAAADGTELAFSDRFAVGVGVSDTKLSIISPSGATIISTNIREDFGSAIKLSPDKTKLVAEWSNLDIGDPGGLSIQTVFSRNGQIQRRYSDYDSSNWLPNGRLLLVRGNELFSTDPSTTAAPVLIIKTVNDIGGVTANRQGTKLAFLMKGSVYVVNVDGTGLKKLTESANLLGDVDWSPDGQYLAVSHAKSSYTTWIVPADGVRVPLDLYSVTSAFRVRESATDFMSPSSKISWR